MQSEKRKNLRLDFGVVIIHNHKQGMTKDISFSFDFPNTDNYIDVKGTIIHHVNDDGMGIWFKRIDDRAKDFIGMFVSDYLQRRRAEHFNLILINQWGE